MNILLLRFATPDLSHQGGCCRDGIYCKEINCLLMEHIQTLITSVLSNFLCHTFFHPELSSLVI